MAYKVHKILFLLMIAIAGFTFVAVLPATSHAEGNNDQSYTLLEPIPCIPDGKVTCPPATQGKISLLEKVNLGDFFQYAFNLLIALSAVAAVFMMIWGGFLYVATTSFQDKNKGKEYFKNAIYGLLMVLGAYIVLRTVNPSLVTFPKSIPAIQNKYVPYSPLDFFGMVNSDVEKYQIATAEAKKARNEAEKEISQSQNKIQELRKQYSEAIAKGDETKMNTLQVEIANEEDRIIEQKTVLVTELTKAMTSQTLSSVYSNPTGPDFSPKFNRSALGATAKDQNEAIQNNINTLNSSYKDKVNMLKKQGINQIPAEMESEKKFAESMLLVGLYNQGSTPAAIQEQIGKLNDLKNKVAPTIINAQEKENLIKAIDVTLKEQQATYSLLMKSRYMGR